jgi:hypothetical protein
LSFLHALAGNGAFTGRRAGGTARPRRAAVLSARVLAVGVAAASAIAMLAAPSSASPEATISRSIWLGDHTDGSALLPGNGERSIYLAQGWYTYGYTLSGPNGTAADSRVLYLDAGWYTWGCALEGLGDTALDYATYCNLSPPTPGGTAYLPADTLSAGMDDWYLQQGTWNWTGYLDPHF